MKILFGITTAIILSTLIYLGFNSTNDEEKLTLTDDSKKTIILETPTIEYLHPHKHEVSDTVHDHGHHVTVRSEVILAQEDLWITGFTFNMENAPYSTLHHAQLTDLDGVSNTCKDKGLPNELLSIGEDTLGSNTLQFDNPQGIFIPKGHRLEMFAMFHNPEPPVGFGGDYYDVSAKLELTYELAKESDRHVPLRHYHLHLDDRACTGLYTFAVPPETTDFKRVPQYTDNDPAIVQFEEPGEIVYIGGHLHGWEGGKLLEFLKNGESIRQYETKRSDRSDMKWETPHHRESIKIEAGDVVSISATYDNPGPETVTGAMGIISFYFAPDVTLNNN